jgi:hypothetical protein
LESLKGYRIGAKGDRSPEIEQCGWTWIGDVSTASSIATIMLF